MKTILIILALLAFGCTPTIKCTRPHVASGTVGGEPVIFVFSNGTVRTVLVKE